MKIYRLEEVFNEAAYPNVTFVKPKEYPYIRSAMLSEGKHITISGPSGTGKTTLIKSLLRDLEIRDSEILWINGRQYSDVQTVVHIFGLELKCEQNYEEIVPLLQIVKFVVIDDFHHLLPNVRLELAQRLKLFHEQKIRFITIGIAGSASELYGADPELGIRNDPFELKTQEPVFGKQLLCLGEEALNIQFSSQLSEEINTVSNGVPSILQVVCKNCCIQSNIRNTVQEDKKIIDLKLSDLRESILRVFHTKYFDKVVGLAKGKQQARSVHNTYFDIIANIAREETSEIPTELLYRNIVGSISDTKLRSRKATSYYNCLNNLSDVISQKGLDDTIMYRKGAKYISIEDPTFRFYLNLLDMNDILKHIDVRNDDYPYDVAVSFAGDIRETVHEFVEELKKYGLIVFYDFDQQAIFWGKDLRRKLAEIYANESRYMVIFLSQSYPEKDWPDFELAIGKDAAEKRTEEYLLPFIVDDVKVVGINSNIGYVRLNEIGVEGAAKILNEKIHLNTQSKMQLNI